LFDLDGFEAKINVSSLLHQHATIRGMEVGSKQDFAEINRAIAANDIHSVIDKVFSFEQAQQAFEYLDRGLHFGKVAIAIN
jgi:NADPH:quinone reductase-like Zn-dependent oxidoreductase